MATKLEQWMRANLERDETLAPKLGISRVHASRLRRGINRPRPDLALRLEDLTGIPAELLIMEGRRP